MQTLIIFKPLPSYYLAFIIIIIFSIQSVPK